MSQSLLSYLKIDILSPSASICVRGVRVGIQVSCSAEDNSAIRDGRLGWSHTYFRLLNIAGHLFVYNRTSPPPK